MLEVLVYKIKTNNFQLRDQPQILQLSTQASLKYIWLKTTSIV